MPHAVDFLDLGLGAVAPRQARLDLGIPFSAIAGTFAIEIVQANSFSRGEFLSAKTSADWVLASNDDREKQADGICAKALGDRFWVASIDGLPFELIAHGLVISAPPLNVAWLGLDGAMTMTQPAPTSGGILQQVARPWTPNLITLRFGDAQIV